MIKSTIKNSEIDKKSALTDDDIQAILRTSVKRGKESIEQFSKAGREDLVAREKEELSVIQEYLPQQLGEEEIRNVLSEVIAEAGASGPGAMGTVMKAAMTRLTGQADGKVVNKLVREMLEG